MSEHQHAPGGLWAPYVGPRFEDYVATYPPSAQQQKKNEILASLSRLPDPSQAFHPQVKQLVVGNVQSGKTGTFIGTVIAAGENGFAFTVVLAGRLTSLVEQTLARFVQALVPSARGELSLRQLRSSAERATLGEENWKIAVVPTCSARNGRRRYQLAEEIRNSSVAAAGGKPGHLVLIVLKNPNRIASLNDILDISRSLGGMGLPSIMIDDECDEASLNGLAATNLAADLDHDAEMTRVYAGIRLCVLRNSRLNVLMYTATPHASLLLTTRDVLSPDVLTVLHPSPGYVGPLQLFSVESQFNKQTIPEDELVSEVEKSPFPPHSLKICLLYFGLASLCLRASGRLDSVSMLVHPTQFKKGHALYRRFCDSLLNLLTHELAGESLLPDTKRSLQEACEFLPTVGLSELEAATIVRIRAQIDSGQAPDGLTECLKNVSVVVMNSDSDTKSVDWSVPGLRILVGGEILGRGYTVENLVVTYMPRQRATTADTTLQRCRFFGYRDDYRHWLRGWFDAETVSALNRMARADDLLRTSLQDVEGKSLKDFRRYFMLAPGMKPTRKAVISMQTANVKNRSDWVFRQRLLVVQPRPEAMRSSALEQYLASFRQDLRPMSELDARLPDHANSRWLSVRSGDAIGLLEQWPVADDERGRLQAATTQIALASTVADFDVHLVFLGIEEGRWRSVRTESRDSPSPYGYTFELFQGEVQGSEGGEGSDKILHAPAGITVQIHRIYPRLTRNDGLLPGLHALVGHDAVFGVAIRLPDPSDWVLGYPQ